LSLTCCLTSKLHVLPEQRVSLCVRSCICAPLCVCMPMCACGTLSICASRWVLLWAHQPCVYRRGCASVWRSVHSSLCMRTNGARAKSRAHLHCCCLHKELCTWRSVLEEMCLTSSTARAIVLVLSLLCLFYGCCAYFMVAVLVLWLLCLFNWLLC